MRHETNPRIVDQEATACREAPIFDSYPDLDDEFDLELANCPGLTIVATPQGHFLYWQGSGPAKLLDNARLVACLQDLPYQKRRPLSPIEEEGVGDTIFVDYSTTHDSSPDHQVYVSIHGENNGLGLQAEHYANENLEQISDDKLSVNAPQGECQQDKDAII